MKQIIYILILLVVIAGCTAPADDATRAVVTEPTPEPAPSDPVKIDTPQPIPKGPTGEKAVINQKVFDLSSTFEWEGFGPGKSHLGKFTEMKGTFTYTDGKLTKVEGIIQTASLVSEIGRLTNHLKSEAFFNVQKHPTITAVSKKIDMEKQEVTGELTMLGITQELTFPAEITKNSVKADFVINTHDWGMVYKGANKEARIFFHLKSA